MIKIKYWLFHSPFDYRWPLRIWFYKWGVGMHWRTIEDAHIEIVRIQEF